MKNDKKEIEKTNAVRLLQQMRIEFKTHDYSSTGAVSADEVATALSEDPNRVFKTLVTVGKSNKNYVFVVPACKELDLKKAASVVGEKNIAMIKSKELLPLTGYIHGGCSPIGMKKFFTTVIDSTAENYETILFSGGKIGLQIEMSINDLKKVIKINLANITE